MKRPVRFFLPAVLILAVPWNGWSSTEPDPGDAPEARVSFIELPMSGALELERDFESPAAPATQGSTSSMRPYAYGNFAAGRCNHGYAILGGGGGGEFFATRRLAIGADGGYYQFIDDVSFGLVMATVGAHFGDASGSSRADPFISVSPGFYFAGSDGSGAGFALGAGGGVNYWFNDRFGLHTDLRFAALGTEEGVVLFRVGVAFH